MDRVGCETGRLQPCRFRGPVQHLSQLTALVELMHLATQSHFENNHDLMIALTISFPRPDQELQRDTEMPIVKPGRGRKSRLWRTTPYNEVEHTDGLTWSRGQCPPWTASTAHQEPNDRRTRKKHKSTTQGATVARHHAPGPVTEARCSHRKSFKAEGSADDHGRTWRQTRAIFDNLLLQVQRRSSAAG